MKRTLTIASAFALVAAMLMFTPTQKVTADTPSINITAPTGTVFVSSFPYAATITMTITHNELKGLNVLEVLVDDVSLSGVIGSPFDNSNNCSGGGTPPWSNCSTNGSDQATVSFPWSVPGPGTYTVGVRTRHQGNEGVDEEDVVFNLVAVEYPAPPAIANAYLKLTYGKLGAKRHGCVLSAIANQHAHDSAFGPKGGPYCKNGVGEVPGCTKAVHQEVEALLTSSCP